MMTLKCVSEPTKTQKYIKWNQVIAYAIGESEDLALLNGLVVDCQSSVQLTIGQQVATTTVYFYYCRWLKEFTRIWLQKNK